jgi:hypothetical protein
MKVLNLAKCFKIWKGEDREVKPHRVQPKIHRVFKTPSLIINRLKL